MQESYDNQEPVAGAVYLLPGERPQPVAIPRRGVGTTTRFTIGTLPEPVSFPVPKTPETRSQERRLSQAMAEYPIEPIDSTQAPVTLSDANANRQVRYSDAAERVRKSLQKGQETMDPRLKQHLAAQLGPSFTRLDYIIAAAGGAAVIAVLIFFWPTIQQALGSLFTPRAAAKVAKVAKHVKPAVSSAIRTASKSRVL